MDRVSGYEPEGRGFNSYHAAKAYAKAKPLVTFINSVVDKKQERQAEVSQIALASGTTQDQLRYVPIIARQD